MPIQRCWFTFHANRPHFAHGGLTRAGSSTCSASSGAPAGVPTSRSEPRRPAVVLVVNDRRSLDRARERLYVGLSRARDQLVVCGDPAFIAEYGGRDVARRLGIATSGQ